MNKVSMEYLHNIIFSTIKRNELLEREYASMDLKQILIGEKKPI